MANDEAQDWQELIQSDGWQRLRQFANEQWNTEKMESYAVTAAEKDDPSALSALRQIIAAKRAVWRVLNYPELRIRTLAELDEASAALHEGRRGAL